MQPISKFRECRCSIIFSTIKCCSIISAPLFLKYIHSKPAAMDRGFIHVPQLVWVLYCQDIISLRGSIVNPFLFARLPCAMTWFICLPRRKASLLLWRRYWRNCDSSFALKIHGCIALVRQLCQSVPSKNQTPCPFMFLTSSPICRCTTVDIFGGLDVIRFLLQ